MKATTIRPFLPSIDFETSKSFYKEMGFTITYEEEKMVILTAGDVSFFLQDAYLKEWAENLMIQIFVDDLEKLHKIASKLCLTYNGFELEPIFEAHYGHTFRLHGPAGELWHVMQSK